MSKRLNWKAWLLAGVIAFSLGWGIFNASRADHVVRVNDVANMQVVCDNEEALIPMFELWLMGPLGATPLEAETAVTIFNAAKCETLNPGARGIVSSVQRKGIDYEGDKIYIIEVTSPVDPLVTGYTLVWASSVIHIDAEATQ